MDIAVRAVGRDTQSRLQIFIPDPRELHLFIDTVDIQIQVVISRIQADRIIEIHPGLVKLRPAQVCGPPEIVSVQKLPVQLHKLIAGLDRPVVILQAVLGGSLILKQVQHSLRHLVVRGGQRLIEGADRLLVAGLSHQSDPQPS